jgi:hypothetical protein
MASTARRRRPWREAWTGARERLGARPTPEQAAWLDRWWPLAEPGERAEIGRTRDEAWAGVVRRIEVGVAVAIDYAASPRRHRHGTLAAYRHGRAVEPVPDGSCDLRLEKRAMVIRGASVHAVHDKQYEQWVVDISLEAKQAAQLGTCHTLSGWSSTRYCG